MKKTLVTALALLSIFAISGGAIIANQDGTILAAHAATEPTAKDWHEVKTYENGCSLEFDADENMVAMSNPNAFVNFAVTNDFNSASANYEFSFDWVSTTTGLDKEFHAGIVPWYVDDGTFLMMFVKTGMGPGTLIEYQLFVNGKHATIWNGKLPSENEGNIDACFYDAHNQWGFGGAPTGLAVQDPKVGGTFAFRKTRTQLEGTPMDQFDIWFNKPTSETPTLTIFPRESIDLTIASKRASVGFYSFGGYCVNTNIQFTNLGYTGTLSQAGIDYIDLINGLTCADVQNKPTETAKKIADAEALLNDADKLAISEITTTKDRVWKITELAAYYTTMCSHYATSGAKFFENKENTTAIIAVSTTLGAMLIIAAAIVLTKKLRRN